MNGRAQENRRKAKTREDAEKEKGGEGCERTLMFVRENALASVGMGMVCVACDRTRWRRKKKVVVTTYVTKCAMSQLVSADMGSDLTTPSAVTVAISNCRTMHMGVSAKLSLP